MVIDTRTPEIQAQERIEQAAGLMSDAKRSEAAWYLRGVADALFGRPNALKGSGHIYRNSYQRGFHSLDSDA